MGKTRFVWIDSIKIFACLLVVLGHLYMSMMASGWIDENAVYYCLPIQTIYTFHVPLFFVCSGFLYQIKRADYSIKSHMTIIKEKALSLGVPYFFFSSITILLKIIFSSEVNNQATSYWHTLFLEPIAPYWYLYTLFFLFCLIPRFKRTQNMKVAFLITILIKIIYVIIPDTSGFPYIIAQVMSNAIWFMLGIILTQENIRRKLQYKWLSFFVFLLGMIFSVSYYQQNNSSKIVQFVIAILFVYSLVTIFLQVKYTRGKEIISSVSKYCLPVYLMHTIFAAGTRIVLLKIGINVLFIHLVVGLIASIVLPMIAYKIVKRFRCLIVWIEPLKVINIKNSHN